MTLHLIGKRIESESGHEQCMRIFDLDFIDGVFVGETYIPQEDFTNLCTAYGDGRVKIFPCKIGDTIWYIGVSNYTTPAVFSQIVDDISLYSLHAYDRTFGFDQLGLAWWKTEAEAQSALDHRNSEGNTK